MTVNRQHWLRHVQDVIRSRHYTWLPRGLGGEKVETAMSYLLTDVMHICQLCGVSFDVLLKTARERFDAEAGSQSTPHPPRPNRLSPQANPVKVGYHTDDPFEAEIMRARFEAAGIPCRVDSLLRGGLQGQVDAKVMVAPVDVQRAADIVAKATSQADEFPT